MCILIIAEINKKETPTNQEKLPRNLCAPAAPPSQDGERHRLKAIKLARFKKGNANERLPVPQVRLKWEKARGKPSHPRSWRVKCNCRVCYSHPADRLVSSITRHKGNGGPNNIWFRATTCVAFSDRRERFPGEVHGTEPSYGSGTSLLSELESPRLKKKNRLRRATTCPLCANACHVSRIWQKLLTKLVL